MDFNFIACNQFNIESLGTVEEFIDKHPDFQTVVLSNENELQMLLELMNIPQISSQDLNSNEFSKFWNLSSFRLPELDDQQFNNFYEAWIEKSQRENNMNEYGSLIFLQGLSKKWNKLKYRLIVQ